VRAAHRKTIMKTQTPNSTAELASNALASLATALESGKSEALTSYLSVMARFHNYSWNNCLLIALQRPDATHVAGFHAWLKLGRHVRKGEKGIAILAPILCKLHADGSEEKHQDESGLNSALCRLVGFRTAYVFDGLSRDSRIRFCALVIAKTCESDIVWAADGRRA
jgi:N-terminal domain of anti-restriction factor ArdC